MESLRVAKRSFWALQFIVKGQKQDTKWSRLRLESLNRIGTGCFDGYLNTVGVGLGIRLSIGRADQLPILDIWEYIKITIGTCCENMKT